VIYHLDTTFLIDWHRRDVRISALREEIIAGVHDVSINPIVEAEYFSARRVTREKEMTFAAVAALSEMIPLSSEACRLAARWLARLDIKQRRAHFNDALIAATSTVAGATLISSDKRIVRAFPVTILQY
jgi:predicted nucleic acid-binding protein